MREEILDEDDSDFATEWSDAAIESKPAREAQPDARRRIEELMDLRRLESLLDDPFREGIEE